MAKTETVIRLRPEKTVEELERDLDFLRTEMDWLSLRMQMTAKKIRELKGEPERTGPMMSYLDGSFIFHKSDGTDLRFTLKPQQEESVSQDIPTKEDGANT